MILNFGFWILDEEGRDAAREAMGKFRETCRKQETSFYGDGATRRKT